MFVNHKANIKHYYDLSAQMKSKQLVLPQSQQRLIRNNHLKTNRLETSVSHKSFKMTVSTEVLFFNIALIIYLSL